MTWASHPTTEMPPPPVSSGGRHRGRRRGVVFAGLVAALVVAFALAASVVPKLIPTGAPAPAAPPQSSAATAAAPAASAPEAPVPSAAVPSAPAPTTAVPPTSTASVSDAETLEAAVVSLTNAERAKAGCAALKPNDLIAAAARAHSVEMATTGSFSHNGANGSSPGDRMRTAGYDARRGWAENIAHGQATAAAVMSAWMGSEGHRANILNCTLTAIGVGTARAANGSRYWTQDFGMA